MKFAPVCSIVIRCAVRWVDCISRSSPAYLQNSDISADLLQAPSGVPEGCFTSRVNPETLPPALPGTPEGQCVSQVNYVVWPPWDFGLIATTHSQLLPVTEIQYANVINLFYWVTNRYDDWIQHLTYQQLGDEVFIAISQVFAWDPKYLYSLKVLPFHQLRLVVCHRSSKVLHNHLVLFWRFTLQVNCTWCCNNTEVATRAKS